MVAPTKRSLDSSIVRRINATEAEIELFVSRLGKFLDDNLSDIVGKLDGKSFEPMKLARLLGGVKTSLADAGLFDEIAKLEAVYGNELRIIQDSFARLSGKNITLTEIDLDIVEQLIVYDANEIANKINAYVDSLNATIFRSVVGGVNVDFESIRAVEEPFLLNKITAEFNTAMQGFNRSLTQSKAAQSGFELFYYVGPDDGVTRPFCKSRVGEVFTSAAISTWDNGQGLPANVYLGGYNCRHRLVPVTEEYARDVLGYDG